MKTRFLVVFCFFLIISFFFIFAFSQNLPSGLPEDINSYRKWTRLNKKLIGPKPSDPHRGFKRIYINKLANELTDSSMNLVFPYPEGTIIVKEVRKTKNKKSKIVLVSIMRKQTGNESTGGWDFIEFSRNSDSSFSKINFSKESCYACHQGASDSDSVWTKFDNF